MSFVVGFVTGMATGESVERRKGRRHFREYMKRQGFTVVDQNGRPVSLDVVLDEVLASTKVSTNKMRSEQTLAVVGVAVIAIAVLTSGSALAAAAVLS